MKKSSVVDHIACMEILSCAKMVADMERVAKEMIKPSSPTPHHLRSHRLSFLDQIAPPIYTPLIFFYQLHGDDHGQISQLLKQSLSETLTRFYPLAGRISEGFVIDCNDAGALFVEARVHADLLQVVDKPNMEELREYLPLELTTSREGGIGEKEKEKENILLAVQINFFDCGGIAIGVTMSHKIADGTSLVTFMNAWAAICRGDAKNSQYSTLDIANLFPPRDLSSFGFMPATGITKEKIITKRFLFSKEKLAKLKESASSAPGSKVKDPTRVEAVSAFIWRHFIEMNEAKMGTKKKVAALHAVNLRPRMHPPLPDQTFGNLWRHTLAIPMSMEETAGYHNLVAELRRSIKNINSNYVKKIQNGEEYIHILKRSVELFSNGEIELCNFSSWCRFPLYEVDYGWGKPVWVCTTTLPFKNVAILMSTRSGDGIEAWINMPEDDAGGLMAIGLSS